MPNYLDDAHRAEVLSLSRTIISRTEWPTWLLLVGFYLAWGTVVLAKDALGEVFTVVLLIPLVVLWMSIQHELIHGHPTRWPTVNKALGYLPFAIWYPYEIYKETHLAHHNDEVLTAPGLDPESRYVTNDFWMQSPSYIRTLLWINKTLGGRLIVGAPLSLLTLITTELRGIFRSGPRNLTMWLGHLLSVVALLVFVEHFSAISAVQYVFLVSIPALSVAMIRSFYEHRPAERPEHRSVITESSGPLSWLFLNLNLHLIHHDLPRLPWFHLPRVYKARRAQWIARNNGFVIQGYSELVRQHLARPVDCPVHPVER